MVSPLRVRIGRRSEVEPRTIRHRGVVQDAVQDLELGDALAAAMRLQPRLPLEQVRRVGRGRRRPAVALAQETHEVRARAFDLGEADRQHLAPLRLLGGDAPPQVDVDQLDEALLQAGPQRGENLPNQQVPLGGEVPESGRYEDARRTGLGHCQLKSDRRTLLGRLLRALVVCARSTAYTIMDNETIVREIDDHVL
jgi:hypothetical protein